MYKIAQVAILVFWGVALFNFVQPLPVPWYQAIAGAFIFMIVVHLIEMLVFTRWIKQYQMDKWKAYMGIMLFGMFWMGEALAKYKN